MNGRLFLVLLAVCAIIHGTGCNRGLNAKDRSEFTPISKGISRASSLTLYEGLPNQSWEADELKNELATKRIVRLHGFPFYERPLSVAAAEIETLRHLSSAAGSFSSYGGPKPCGGFHPDYCLSWNDGEASYELLICFNCHEMKLYGSKREILADIRSDAFTQFENTLKKYRDQRPKRD